MAVERLTSGLVYRYGQNSVPNMTPRPGIDTSATAGRVPGLSTADIPRRKPAQTIDVAKLAVPLAAFRDGANHVAIVPITDAGEVDQALLDEWAASRTTGATHALTALLRAAVA